MIYLAKATGTPIPADFQVGANTSIFIHKKCIMLFASQFHQHSLTRVADPYTFYADQDPDPVFSKVLDQDPYPEVQKVT